MLKMTTLIRFTLVLCMVFAMSACGQKGDLYLPEGNALIVWLG